MFFRMILVLSTLNFFHLTFCCESWILHANTRTSHLSTISWIIFQFWSHFEYNFKNIFGIIQAHTLTYTRSQYGELSHCERLCCGNKWSGKMINISKRVTKQINQINDLTRYGSLFICVYYSQMSVLTRKHTHSPIIRQTIAIGVSCLSAFFYWNVLNLFWR